MASWHSCSGSSSEPRIEAVELADHIFAARQPDVAAGVVSTPSLHEGFAASQIWAYRRATAANTSVCPALLDRLAHDLDILVRLFVAENPSTPAATLAHLAVDGDTSIIAAVAKNPSTSPELLTSFAASGWLLDDVHQNVAANPSTPMDVVTNLVERFPRSVAQNPAAPPTLLASLFPAANQFVRLQLAFNQSTPPGILAELALDGRTRTTVVQNPSTPAATLETLSYAADRVVLEFVAANPSTPVSELERLVAMEDNLAPFVAANLSAPPALLAELFTDGGYEVRLPLAKNPSTPVAMLIALLEAARPRGQIDMMTALACHLSMPVEALATLSYLSVKDTFHWPRLCDMLEPVPASVAQAVAGLAPNWSMSVATLIAASYASVS